MENIIDKEMCGRALTRITEVATAKGWHGIKETNAYKIIVDILAMDDDKIGYAEKETLHNMMELLCVCSGQWYYGIIQEVCA